MRIDKSQPSFTKEKTLLGIDDVGTIGFNGSHAPDKEKAFGEPVERHLGQKSMTCYCYFKEDRPRPWPRPR